MVNDHVDIIYHIPYRYPIFHIDTHIDIPLISDIPYRYLIPISDHISLAWPLVPVSAQREHLRQGSLVAPVVPSTGTL